MAALLHPPPPEQNYLEKLDVFKIKGRDKQGRRILRITGKFFPARVVSLDVLKKHLEEKIFPRLKNKRFTILYFHTGVQRSQNFPGIAALRSIYDAIPAAVKANLEAVYFVHPDLQARLFLATLGRIFFTSECLKASCIHRPVRPPISCSGVLIRPVWWMPFGEAHPWKRINRPVPISHCRLTWKLKEMSSPMASTCLVALRF